MRRFAPSVLLLTLALPATGQSPSVDAAMLSGVHFRHIGPATMSGRITDLAILESDPTLMYVASATGGVWKTTDNAITMKPVFERERVHSVGAVALFQGDANVVWVERARRPTGRVPVGVTGSTGPRTVAPRGRTWA